MRACARLWLALAIALSLFAAPLRAQFAYVANFGSNNVSGYTINPSTGALTAIAGSPFLAGSGPFSVAVDPSGKFAYVANNDSNNVSGYTINPSTGALAPMAGSPLPGFPAGAAPISVAVDPTGKFVYVANDGSNSVSGYMINPSTGALTPITGSPFPASVYPESVTVDPSGKFAYVANNGSNSVSGYTINPTTGALAPMAGSPLPGFPAGSGPVFVAVHPSGKFAYVANADSNTVSGYTIDSTTGALSAITGSPFAAGAFPRSVAVDPSGKFAYVANFNSNNVSGYMIDSTTGALTAIASSPFPAGAFARSVAVGPGGKFAYVANFGGNVSGYTIDSTTGALSAMALPFPAGAGPASVAITKSQVTKPQVHLVYTTNAGSNSVSVIDPSTNTVTATVPVGSDPVQTVLTPNGATGYVLNTGAGMVSVLNTATNSITATLKVGLLPARAAITPDGSSVYVTNSGSKSVSVISTAESGGDQGNRRRAGQGTAYSPGALRGYCARDINPRCPAPSLRRLATLLVFVREMEADLTDAALTMFDKMMGGEFCKADRQHKNNLVDRAKTLDSSARARTKPFSGPYGGRRILARISRGSGEASHPPEVFHHPPAFIPWLGYVLVQAG
jgi:YVTN family beta-propeller protein